MVCHGMSLAEDLFGEYSYCMKSFWNFARCFSGMLSFRTKPRSFPNKLPEYPVSARLRACVIDQENIVDVCPSIGRVAHIQMI